MSLCIIRIAGEPLMTANPFPSFSMLLPDDVVEDHDGTVASYWKKGNRCLLQLSSFRRDSGPQVSAAQRLSDRMEMGGTWQPFSLPHEIRGCEAIAASTIDEHGTVWLHAYLVWPWLTVHVTVSRRSDFSDCEWAWRAVSSIHPVVM
jgi:hypothetical protein